MPSTWYVVEMLFETYQIFGAVIPGTPIISSGQNGYMNFGITAYLGDTCDLYAERISEDNKKYFHGG